MKAEICEGEYCLPSEVTQASPLAALDDLVGDEAHVLLGHRIVERAADQALDREEGALRIGHGLALGRLADEALAVVGEGDDRGRGARALGILDDLGRRPFHDGDAGIGRAEVDADDFSHKVSPVLCEIIRSRSDRTKRTTPTGPDLAVELLLIPSCSSVAAKNRRAREASNPPVRAYIGAGFLGRKARKQRNFPRAARIGRETSLSLSGPRSYRLAHEVEAESS